MGLDVVFFRENSLACIAIGDAASAFDTTARARFDVIVYAARELQPDHRLLSAAEAGVRPRIERCPLVEGEMNEAAAHAALQAADAVAAAFVQDRQRVLVTSARGRERACLIAALAMHIIGGCGGIEAMRVIRAARVHLDPDPATGAPAVPLRHPAYVEMLSRIAPRKRSKYTIIDLENASRSAEPYDVG